MTNSFPKKNDMLIDQHQRQRGWVKTEVVETVSGQTKRAVVLVPCSVSDPDRFGYFDGKWWKLESGEPERRVFKDKMGEFTAQVCEEGTGIFYLDGKWWGPVK
jgi:hypothetical protein